MTPDLDWYRDTDPRALEVFLEGQRRMPPGEKIQAALELSAMMLRVSEAGVRRLYPLADEREVLARTAARHLDRETVIKVYGFDPDAA